MFGLFIFFFLLLVSVAYLTLFERHMLGGSQLRYGPNKPLMGGWFQPFLDALKLLQKELIWLYSSSERYYLISPLLMFFLWFLHWYAQPYLWFWTNMMYSSLYLLCLVGVSVYTKFMAGYYSGSKFSYLGGMRATVQSVSFEVSFFFVVMSYLFVLSEFEFGVNGNLLLLPLFVLWFLFIMVELGRMPMDFSEAESELVSGYNLEFGGVLFIYWFLSEYGFLLFWSSLTSYMFFSWTGLPSISFYLIMWSLLFFRSVLPRYRYDKVMMFFWGSVLPWAVLMMVVYYSMVKLL